MILCMASINATFVLVFGSRLTRVRRGRGLVGVQQYATGVSDQQRPNHISRVSPISVAPPPLHSLALMLVSGAPRVIARVLACPERSV